MWPQATRDTRVMLSRVMTEADQCHEMQRRCASVFKGCSRRELDVTQPLSVFFLNVEPRNYSQTYLKGMRNIRGKNIFVLLGAD